MARCATSGCVQYTRACMAPIPCCVWRAEASRRDQSLRSRFRTTVTQIKAQIYRDSVNALTNDDWVSDYGEGA